MIEEGMEGGVADGISTQKEAPSQEKISLKGSIIYLGLILGAGASLFVKNNFSPQTPEIIEISMNIIKMAMGAAAGAASGAIGYSVVKNVVLPIYRAIRGEPTDKEPEKRAVKEEEEKDWVDALRDIVAHKRVNEEELRSDVQKAQEGFLLAKELKGGDEVAARNMVEQVLAAKPEVLETAFPSWYKKTGEEDAVPTRTQGDRFASKDANRVTTPSIPRGRTKA